MLDKPDLSLHCRVATQLRLAEKQILEKASASGRAKRLHFEKKLEDGAALPRYEESDIALLENTDDAKIPIVLHELEEVEEGQQTQGGELSGLVNGQKEAYAPVEASGETRRAVYSTLDSTGSSSASRTEEDPKESSE